MTQMKAVRIHAYGGLETLVYEDTPRPEPGAGQVLIQVCAAGVNPMDWKIRSGWFEKVFNYSMPLILGTDVSGIVTAVGSGVTHLQPGQGVYGVADMTLSGAYAEYALGLAGAIAPLPQSLSYIEAATVPIVAMTAWQGLFDIGKLTQKQTVLIHGAAGGVGSFAVQFAKLHNLEVIATTSAHNQDYVRILGADRVIDYHSTRFFEVVNNVDMVFDTQGAEVQTKSFDVLKPGGILVSTVSPPEQSLAQNKGVRAAMLVVQPNSNLLIEIANLIDSNTIQLPPIQTFPLKEARQAHELSQNGHVNGKLVLQVI